MLVRFDTDPLNLFDILGAELVEQPPVDVVRNTDVPRLDKSTVDRLTDNLSAN